MAEDDNREVTSSPLSALSSSSEPSKSQEDDDYQELESSEDEDDVSDAASSEDNVGEPLRPPQTTKRTTLTRSNANAHRDGNSPQTPNSNDRSWSGGPSQNLYVLGAQNVASNTALTQYATSPYVTADRQAPIPQPIHPPLPVADYRPLQPSLLGSGINRLDYVQQSTPPTAPRTAAILQQRLLLGQHDLRNSPTANPQLDAAHDGKLTRSDQILGGVGAPRPDRSQTGQLPQTPLSSQSSGTVNFPVPGSRQPRYQLPNVGSFYSEHAHLHPHQQAIPRRAPVLGSTVYPPQPGSVGRLGSSAMGRSFIELSRTLRHASNHMVALYQARRAAGAPDPNLPSVGGHFPNQQTQAWFAWPSFAGQNSSQSAPHSSVTMGNGINALSAGPAIYPRYVPIDHALNSQAWTNCDSINRAFHPHLQLQQSENPTQDLTDTTALQLRSSRASRLAARSHQDIDVLSGYPARQWVKETSTVSLIAPKAQPEQQQIKKESRFHELPMPRGSELYAPHAQALLRRARAPTVPEDDKITLDEKEDDATGDEDKAVRLPKYTQVTLGQETPGPKYLAERRKGLTSLPDDGSQPRRKAKVKQILTDGTERVIEVLVPTGQSVPGEMTDAAPLVPEILPPGTVVEGVGIANREGIVIPATEVTTPQSNRKPPPPKRKKTHPLKGKKKKVLFEVPNADGTIDMIEGAASGGTPRPDEDEDEEDDGEDGDTPADSPMPDGPGIPSKVPEIPRSAPDHNPPPAIVISSGNSQATAGGIQSADKGTAATSLPSQSDSSSQSEPSPVVAQIANTSATTSTTTPASDIPLTSADNATEALQDAEPAAASTAPAVPGIASSHQPVPGAPTMQTGSADLTSSAPDAVSNTTVTETQEAASDPKPFDALPETSASIGQQPALAETEKPDATSSASFATPAGEFVPASTQAAESIQSAATENVVAQAAPPATEDAVPDALKPEEIALSNPTAEEAKALAAAKEQDEQKKNDATEPEQTDVLGSLEDALG